MRSGRAVRAAVYSSRLEQRPHVSIDDAIELIKCGRAIEIKTSSASYAIQLTEDDHFEPSKSAPTPAGITYSEMQAAVQGSQRALDKIAAWGASTIRHRQDAMVIC